MSGLPNSSAVPLGTHETEPLVKPDCTSQKRSGGQKHAPASVLSDKTLDFVHQRFGDSPSTHGTTATPRTWSPFSAFRTADAVPAAPPSQRASPAGPPASAVRFQPQLLPRPPDPRVRLHSEPIQYALSVN